MLSALAFVCPRMQLQLRRAHRPRNITDKIRRKDRDAVKRDVRRRRQARKLRAAQEAVRRLAAAWEGPYPEAVHCLHTDLEP
jgi:transposase-like protein